ncbi:thermonuclease family protein [Neobacillus mesonae]|uniref:thermonuclease family protein n=1 Tax=Neobacillus mesonae TaxID=1193713 RepID=UPI002E2251D2|nr:thermonuclease family protein [Neobacillus mesonae]
MQKYLVNTAFITSAVILIFSPQESEKVQQSTNSVMEMTGATETGRIPARLVETIDGDTIKVMVMGKIETVRYLLIDTPESKKPGLCVQPYAREAAIRNEQLVKGGILSLEFEQGNTKDSYGRLLAYVYVDGQSVQEKLLLEGLARVAYIINPPYKYLQEYQSDERMAKEDKRMIWSRPGYVTSRGFDGCGM